MACRYGEAGIGLLGGLDKEGWGASGRDDLVRVVGWAGRMGCGSS